MAIPEARHKFRAHIQNLRRIIDSDPDGKSASRIIQCALVAWQEARYPRLRSGVRRPYGTAAYFRQKDILAFAQWLGALEDFNVAAYWLASAYAILVGESIRSHGSLYFTPPLLAHRVIDGLVKSGASLTTQSWHDPACGGAAFLVPIAQRMVYELEKQGKSPIKILRHVQNHLSGTDLEPTLLELSCEFLRMALYRQIEAASWIPSFDLATGNGLFEKPSRTSDVVVCNPPYRKLKSSEAKNYSKIYGEILEGQPNIYGLFIHRALTIVAMNGLVGLLTPTSFLSGQFFSKLRRWLLENANPERIEMLSGRKSTFIDVEQETAIMLARRELPVLKERRYVQLAVRTEAGIFKEIGACTLPDCGRPWPIAKSVDDVPLVLAAAKSMNRLSSYGYRARIGHLVDYRDTRKRMNSKSDAQTGSSVFPLVWATDVAPIGVFQHGRSLKSTRAGRFVQLNHESQGGVIRMPSILLQRVTSTDQPRRLVCAAVPTYWMKEHGGFVAENHVIVIEKIEGGSDDISPEILASVLRTKTVDRLFRSVSGAANVSVYELNEIPLPDPEIVNRLLAIGCDIETAVIMGYSPLVPTAAAA